MSTSAAVAQRRLLVSKMVDLGIPTSVIAQKLNVPPSTIRTDRLMLSVPNPEKVSAISSEDQLVTPSSTKPSMDKHTRQSMVAKMHREGRDGTEIAEALNVSVATVSRDRKALDLHIETRSMIARERREEVKGLIESGATVKEIQKELGVSKTSVFRYLKSVGYDSAQEHEKEVIERRTKVKALIAEGQHYREIAAQLGISFMTVQRDCEALGIRSKHSKSSREARREERHAAVLEGFEDELTVKEIAAKLGIAKATVYRDLEELGLRYYERR